jgi:endonuclease-3
MTTINSKRSASPQAANGKRPRFVPSPPPTVKAEELHSIAPRYSLRQRGAATTAASSSSSSVKVEDEQDAKPIKSSQSPTKKVKADPFAASPRKLTSKPIKIDLNASEARAAPKRWKEQYEVLIKQRRRIVAPVDTMGCQENGKDEKRRDMASLTESDEDRARRERFTILVSLMLSSQTKDPVTADAVHNLQQNLKGGLSLSSILNATQDEISVNINKVGFWRRKTGYIQSTARILQDDFNGDIPNTIDDLCSLPGVGPKMGFLALQSAWGLNMGIGVDVHVHRVSNRLKWVNSNDAEGTRLQLQSWLPKELHPTINKTLVGFGQVICQPVGPRCE